MTQSKPDRKSDKDAGNNIWHRVAHTLINMTTKDFVPDHPRWRPLSLVEPITRCAPKIALPQLRAPAGSHIAGISRSVQPLNVCFWQHL
jgi:hypothetical protein